jgi:hypothetical protein
MAITINGTTGIAGVDGSASTPAVQGADPNTGIFYPAADTIAFAEGGVEAMRIDSSGAYIYDHLGVGVAPSTSATIAGTKSYTSNAQRFGLSLSTTITSETLTANRINYGIYNGHVVTQDALPFTLSSYGIYTEVYNGSANDVTSNSSTMLASYNLVRNRATGTVTNMYGSINQIQNTRTSSITTDMYSAYNKGDVDLGTVTTWRGTYNWLEQDGGTTTTAIGTYNRLDRDGGTLTTAYGVFNSFEGTIGTKLGYIDSAGATVDFGVVGDPLGVTSTSITFGVVDTTTPSNSRVVGQLQYDTKTNFIIGSNSNVGGAPLAASLIFNTSNSIYDPVTDTGGIFRVKAYENGLGDSLVDFSVEGVVFQTTTRNPTTPILNVNLGANNADNVTIQATDVYIFSSYFDTNTGLGPLNLTGGDIRITGGVTTVFDGTTSGTLSIEQTPSVTYSMTSGNLFVLSGSNNGLTSTTAVNTLRFTDTDTSTALNQPLGKIEFFTSDTSTPGARVASYILSSALGTSGGGDIRFGTSANAGTVAEAMRITGANELLVNTTTVQTGAKLAVTGGIQGIITSGTAVVNPTSPASASIDFTGIPSWVKRITVIFSGLSLTSTADILVQLGDSGGIETTGYVSSGSATGTGAAISTSTAGMIIRSAAAASVTSGIMTIQNLTGNSWVASYSGKQSSTSCSYGGGDKTLSATLTQIRITTTSTDTFDAGTVNIFYEG